MTNKQCERCGAHGVHLCFIAAAQQRTKHIEMLDGSKRIIPMSKFTKPKEETK